MASELERLLLSFEADTRKLRDALAGADSSVEKFERGANRSLGKTESRFAAMETRVVGSLKAIGAALAAQFTGQALLGQIGDVAALQKTAIIAGVTAQKLQELRAAARAAGVENSELDGVMTKFAVTMGEFRNRTGDFYEFLRKQAPSIEVLLRATKSQDQAFDVIADTVRRLQTAEEKALFTKKALGESSVLLTAALNEGSKGLVKSAEEARKYGQVVSDDAVRATADLKKEIDALGASLTASFQQKLGDSAPALTGFFKQLREAWDSGLINFGIGFKRAGGPIAVAKPAIQDGGKRLGEFFAEAFDQGVNEKLKLIPEAVGKWDTEVFDVGPQLDELRRKYNEAMGGITDNIRFEFEREELALKLMLERKLITEKEYLAAREQMNVAMGARIAEVYDKETAALRERLTEVANTIDSTIMRGFDDLLRTGKTNFRELIQDMIINLTKLAVQAEIVKPILSSVFSPGSAVGNFFGGSAGSGSELFSALGALIPGRAAGGPVSAGKPYVVGEKRPELFVPHTSGRILPQLPGMGGGSISIDARGADIGVEQRLRAMFAQLQKSQGTLFEGMARNGRRFPTRAAA